jgi:3-dehydroquinate synthase
MMGDMVHVQLEGRGYDIRLGHGFDTVLNLDGDGSDAALVISDTNVDPLYGDAFTRLLESRGYQASRVVVPAGEQSKSLSQASELYEQAFDTRMDRKGLIVALGGGVVGDLAGFVAATYLRGVRLLQVPTSLLAMVDSSVGGKTAVNLPRGKNLVGAFYQPCQVAVNLDTLRTLPDREYRSGLAEVIKYGVIQDESFFEMLETHAEALNARDDDVLQDVIARCCEIKAEVVGQDEREAGLRAILNYGHTLGHAIETVAGYGHLLHGEAVALGMVYAGLVSCHERNFDSADRVVALMQHLGLPVSRDAIGDDVSWTQLREAMASDKKARHAVPTFVLADRLGAVAPGCEVADDVLKATFDAMP